MMLKKVSRQLLLNRKYWPLFAIVILAIFLRTYNVKNTLLFHFDQGYHGLAIKRIWDNKEITLLGHKTDVQGIFHSSLFYYLMLPFYLVSNWNPAGVSTILAAIDAFSVVFIYLTAKNLFDKRTGLISSLFYAVSYLGISYSRWLSNVTLIPFMASLFFYLLSAAKGKREKYFTLAGFVLGVIAQLNGAIGFFILPLWIVYLFYFKKSLISGISTIFKYIASFALPAVGLIVFDLRNNFLVTRSVFSLFVKGKSASYSYQGLERAVQIMKNQMVGVLAFKNIWLAFMLLVIFFYSLIKVWSKKDKESVWVKISLFGVVLYSAELFIYQGIHDFYFVGIIPLFVVCLSWGLSYISKKKNLLFVAVLIIGLVAVINLYFWRGFLSPNFNLVPIGTRNLITLKDRLRAVDFMYERAKGRPFKTEIYIIPYYQEEPWDYVFSWYGKNKYGYLPANAADIVYTIHEPDYDYPYRLEEWLGQINEKYGESETVFKSHDLTVEERYKK